MKRMLEKSVMFPSRRSYWSTGMRKRYHLHSFVSLSRVLTLAMRLSTMKFCPTTIASGAMRM